MANLDTAHANIGRYFAAFSELEQVLDQLVIAIFRLADHPHAESIAALLPFSKKCDLAATSVEAARLVGGGKLGAAQTKSWKSSINQTLRKAADDRNMIAHAKIRPLPDGSVEFDWMSRNGLEPKHDRWDDPRFASEIRKLQKGAEVLLKAVGDLEGSAANLHGFSMRGRVLVGDRPKE